MKTKLRVFITLMYLFTAFGLSASVTPMSEAISYGESNRYHIGADNFLNEMNSKEHDKNKIVKPSLAKRISEKEGTSEIEYNPSAWSYRK